MSSSQIAPLHPRAPGRASQHTTANGDKALREEMCPICGVMVEPRRMGARKGWTCLVGGYAHYFEATYGHLEQWFTHGEGNLREPMIRAMN